MSTKKLFRLEYLHFSGHLVMCVCAKMHACICVCLFACMCECMHTCVCVCEREILCFYCCGGGGGLFFFVFGDLLEQKHIAAKVAGLACSNLS